MYVFNSEQFKAAFNNMSQKLKEVALNENTINTLNNIGDRYKINVGMVDISANVFYVLSGLIPIRDFINSLVENADLDEATAKKIAYEIREKIFAPVAYELAALQPKHEMRNMKYESLKTAGIKNGLPASVQLENVSGLGSQASSNMADESLVMQKLTNWRLIEELKAEQEKEVEPPDYPPPSNLPTQQNNTIAPHEEYAGQNQNKRTIPLTNTVDLRNTK